MPADEPQSVDVIVAGLIAQRLEGKTPDVESVIAAHPEMAEEIRARLKDIEQLSVLWQNLSPGSKPGTPTSLGSFAPGVQLDQFEIIREIGRGGMAVVYLARQKDLGRLVALKVIPNAASFSETARNRFLREAKALASLAHPNIVPLFTAGSSGGALYIAMELVEGASLANIIKAIRVGKASEKASDIWKATVEAKGQSLPAQQPEGSGDESSHPSLDRDYVKTCCEVLVSAARALEVAHKRGIIHRDIKPANMIIDSDGRPHLLDFGLATFGTQQQVTISGEFFGTPHYVSPEQARGQHDRICARTDVYSLGVTLYECMTLSTPFEGDSSPEILTKLLNDEPRSAKQSNPALAKDLNTIIMKALAKNPDERYSSAAEFADDIQRFLDYQPIRAKPTTLIGRTIKRVRRKPVHAALVFLVILVVGVGGPLLLRWYRERQIFLQKEQAHQAEAHRLEQISKFNRLVDEGDILLHRAMVGYRPIWMPDEIGRRRKEAELKFTQALEINPRSFKAHMQRARLRVFVEHIESLPSSPAHKKANLAGALEDVRAAADIRPEAVSAELFLKYLENWSKAGMPLLG